MLELDAGGGFLGARAMNLGATADVEPHLAVTPDGAVVVSGQFTGVVDLDPRPDHELLLTSRGDQDLFVVCFDAAGDFRWVRTFGNGGSDRSTGLAVAGDGSIVVAGRTSGALEEGTEGKGGAFVAGLDAGTGDTVWASSFEEQGEAWVTDLAAGLDGAIILVGYFEGVVDFDPDPQAVDERHAAGGQDLFVLSLAGPGGALRWVRTYGGTGDDRATSLVATAEGAVVLTGYFERTIRFDSSLEATHSSNGFWDGFVLGLDPDGERLWSTSFGGEGWDWGAAVGVVDGEFPAVVGAFQDRVAFVPGADEEVAAGGWDSFLVELDPTGSPLLARTWGDSGWDYADDVAVTQDGSILVLGSFELSPDFDPCGGEDLRSSNGDSDTFVTRLRSDGCQL